MNECIVLRYISDWIWFVLPYSRVGWEGMRSSRTVLEVPVKPQEYPDENSQAECVWVCMWSKELVKRLRKILCYLLSLVLSLLPKSSEFHGKCSNITCHMHGCMCSPSCLTPGILFLTTHPKYWNPLSQATPSNPVSMCLNTCAHVLETMFYKLRTTRWEKKAGCRRAT